MNARSGIISGLAKWGERIRKEPEQLTQAILRARTRNPWFTEDSTRLALQAIATSFLDHQALTDFSQRYPNEISSSKRIGLIMAGNIPLVGFHDVVCVLLSGHHAAIKQSHRDDVLWPALVGLLQEVDSGLASRVEIADEFHADAVIATGSNNTNRYFERYFGSKPHIFRANRNSVAILGDLNPEAIKALGVDVFSYFGLGCRSVSHLRVPPGFDPAVLLDGWQEYAYLADHTAYRNNIDYRLALMLLDRVDHRAAPFLGIMEHADIHSHIGILHYSYYHEVSENEAWLNERKDLIQVVAIQDGLNVPTSCPTVPLGQTQVPRLDDFADGQDTMQFLLSL